MLKCVIYIHKHTYLYVLNMSIYEIVPKLQIPSFYFEAAAYHLPAFLRLTLDDLTYLDAPVRS